MLLKNIPGYKKAVDAAVRQEQTLRRRAFLPHVSAIGKLPVRAFTPRHFLILDELESPFLSGTNPGPEHLAQFLWVVSPEFLIPSPETPLREVQKARAAFVARIARLKFDATLKSINTYIDDALFDRSSGGDDDDRPLACWVAGIINDVAGAYGWPDEILDARGQPIFGAGIMDKPFARLCQYRRMIWLSKYPDINLPNRLSDAAGRRAIRRYTEKGAAAA